MCPTKRPADRAPSTMYDDAHSVEDMANMIQVQSSYCAAMD